MITKLNEEDYRQFLAAVVNKPVQKVLDVYRQELKAVREANDVLEGRDLTLSQGRAQTISELLTIFEKAGELAAASQRSETSGRPAAFY